jgi:hypothetical protein
MIQGSPCLATGAATFQDMVLAHLFRPHYHMRSLQSKVLNDTYALPIGGMGWCRYVHTKSSDTSVVNKSTLVTLGPAVAPVVAGFSVSHKDWHWYDQTLISLNNC